MGLSTFEGLKITYFLVQYRSELWDHLFFDDCLNYLNFNSVSDEICTLNNMKATKLSLKLVWNKSFC